METNKNQPPSQEDSSQSKPLLVKIIAGIVLLIGISGILAWVMFISPGPVDVSDLTSDLTVNLAISIICIVGGLGLFYMKKWGLYLFSIVALYFIIGTIPGMWSSWKTLEIWRSAVWALIIGGGYILYGIISLVYLWSIRNRFK